jgi:hypothetical protein
VSKSLISQKPWEVGDVAARRVKENSGGLGALAARDYFRQFPAQLSVSAAKPGDARREMHIKEVAQARQTLIDAGIIKPVVGTQ